MDTIEILTNDYRRFPANQTYDLYADRVFFKDPLNQFRGLTRYQKMIKFISTWFRDIKMELLEIRHSGNVIYTEWILNWTSPLPWQPRIAISGRSELTLNEEGKIVSHIDYWHCSRWDVLKQHILPRKV